MSDNEIIKNLNHLNKLLNRSFPKEKRAKNLLILFISITLIGLTGVFLSSLLVVNIQWKDVFLSISSGLFASGIFSTALEWINIRNKKVFVTMRLNELKYYCDFFIMFVGDELLNIDEGHTYYEWIDLLLDKYKKDKFVLFELSSRLDNIIKSASFFFSDDYDRFNNPYPDGSVLFQLKRLIIMCNSIKRTISSGDKDTEGLSKYLKKRLPSIIGELFPDLKKNFHKKTSYEKVE